MPPEDENGLGDQTQAISHAIPDHPGDQPAAAVDDHTSRNAKWWNDPGYKPDLSSFCNEDETGLPDPLLAKMAKGDLIAPKQPPPNKPPGTPFIAGGGDDKRMKAYAAGALQSVKDKIGQTGPDTKNRNQTLYQAAADLRRFIRGNVLREDMVTYTLQAAAYATGLTEPEVTKSIHSGYHKDDESNTPLVLPEGYEVPEAYQIDAAQDPTGVHASPEQDAAARPKLWRATDLKPAEQARFLIPKRVPRAAVTVFIGEEGIGKSLFVTMLIALLTTGRAAPDLDLNAGEPQYVVLVITEDNWSTDVRPRLEVAGADLNYVFVMCTDDDGSGAPVFPRDIDVLRDMNPPPAGLFVDAWVDTLPSDLQVKDPQQARRALHPWKELATTTDAAVVLVTHPNRLSSGSARDRYGVTSELRKKARMALYATKDADTGLLLVGPEKSNGTQIAKAEQYRIDAVPYFQPKPDHDGTVPLLVPVGTAAQSVGEALANEFDAEHGGDPKDREAAIRWLEEYLDLNAPAVRSSEVKAEAKKAGIGERTLARARNELKVTIGYEGMPAKSTWSLPAKSAHQLDPGQV
ncbi:hypothetical protein MHPYR_880005 [uncultured Mycobacterium sp.]|uniref:Uncharacterized protein n=1 Tax=uncultured Mycobacterium sp. TaxID=171292 RepID=A0A1Y5PLM5_9MYCO|nr:hypothetical protein MHPYR_880005 [uncultured Mycobacterium sp.]